MLQNGYIKLHFTT